MATERSRNDVVAEEWHNRLRIPAPNISDVTDTVVLTNALQRIRDDPATAMQMRVLAAGCLRGMGVEE